MHRFVKWIKTVWWTRVLFVLFALIMPLAARAGDDDSTLAQLLTKLAMAIIELLGKLLAAMVSMIVKVSEYNDFINALAVVNGWVIVRDVANMFFIVVLLIIAFGTILGQEDYHYKKLLPKMLLLAVFVNFSRTIVGVMIDFAQVIMLTFVNGYKAAAGGNFAQAFQIVELLKFSKDACITGPNPSGSITDWGIFAAAMLALIMVVVSLITVAVILAVLVLRIITLWLLTVLSPIAFLCGAFPQGQKYYTQWWEEFKNMVMVGPMLAFFLWLSLISVGSMNSASQLSQGGEFVPAEGNVEFACSAVGNTQSIMSFILGTMMLLAGVQMAQQMGGAIAGISGQAKGFATRALKTGGLAAGYYAGRRLDQAQRFGQRAILKGGGALVKGIDTKLFGGKGAATVGAIKDRYKSYMETTEKMKEKGQPILTRAAGLIGNLLGRHVSRPFAITGGIFKKAAEGGITANPVMWAHAWKEQRAKRYKDQTIGLGGSAHDILNLMTSLGTEKTQEGYAEWMAEVSNRVKKMMTTTGGVTEQVLEERKIAREGGDWMNVQAADQILAGNKDSNEILKGPFNEEALRNLQRILTSQYVGHKVRDEKNNTEHTLTRNDIIGLLDRARSGEIGAVNPALVFELWRDSSMKAWNGQEHYAARAASNMGMVAFGKGDAQYFTGGTFYDPETHDYKFKDSDIKIGADGRLTIDVDDSIAATIVGKLKNLDMRNNASRLHPGILGNEKSNIEGEKETTGWGEMGKIAKAFFQSAAVPSVLGNIDRTRIDFSEKPMTSIPWRASMREFMDDLRVKKVSEEQLKQIKKFLGGMEKRLQQRFEDMHPADDPERYVEDGQPAVSPAAPPPGDSSRR